MKSAFSLILLSSFFITPAWANCPKGVDPLLNLCNAATPSPKKKSPPKKRRLGGLYDKSEVPFVFGDENTPEKPYEQIGTDPKLWNGWNTDNSSPLSSYYSGKKVRWQFRTLSNPSTGATRWTVYTDAYHVNAQQVDGGTQYGLYCDQGSSQIYVFKDVSSEDNRLQDGENEIFTNFVDQVKYEFRLEPGSGQKDDPNSKFFGRKAIMAVAKVPAHSGLLPALAKGKAVYSRISNTYSKAPKSPDGISNIVSDYRYPLRGSGKAIKWLVQKCGAHTHLQEAPLTNYFSDSWTTREYRTSGGNTLKMAYTTANSGRKFGFYCREGYGSVSTFLTVGDVADSIANGVQRVDLRYYAKGDSGGFGDFSMVAKTVLGEKSIVMPAVRNNYAFYRMLNSKEMRIRADYSSFYPSFYIRILSEDIYSNAGSSSALKWLNRQCRKGLWGNRNKLSGLEFN